MSVEEDRIAGAATGPRTLRQCAAPALRGTPAPVLDPVLGALHPGKPIAAIALALILLLALFFHAAHLRHRSISLPRVGRGSLPRLARQGSSGSDGRYGEVGGGEATQLAKENEQVRRRIARTATIPVYKGTAPGELTIENSVVLLQDKIWSKLRYAERWTLMLPEDELVNGRWVTKTYSRTACRVDLSSELLAAVGTTAAALLSATHVHADLVPRGTDYVPRHKVTATDWLRLLVREQALADEYAKNAREALVAMTLEP